MYFTLTRHNFGHLQSQLFPVYFTVGSCLSTVALATYYLMHPIQMWKENENIQVNNKQTLYLLHRVGKYRRQVFNNELSCEITWNVALILSERSRISATFKSEASRILQCVFVCGTPYMRSHIVPSNVPTSVCEMRLVPASYVRFFRYTS